MEATEIRKRWQRAVAGREQQLAHAAEGFRDLLSLMADLRGPAGCPWDREQSLASLRQYVREEAGEVCSAIDRILEYEAALRAHYDLPQADPHPPAGVDRARTDKKGHTIAHHPHRADFTPAGSASGAPLPRELEEEQQRQLEALYQELLQEMGDLLLQAAFLGEILQAMGRGGVERALSLILAKLIRRHPHVYGDREVADSAEVLSNWEAIKRRERAEAD